MPCLSSSQSWTHSPNVQQSQNLLTPGCDEEKCISLQSQPRRMGSSACAQKAQTPLQLSGKGFYRQCGEGGSQGVHNSLMGCWWSVGNLNHQPSSSSQSGVSMLVVSLQLTSSTCESAQGHGSEYFPRPLRGSLAFDSRYFFLLDSLPLCLHFLTSLIKFALQNSGKA